ncbi:HCL237Cp [Eremothecium sinecaudum]|uniref:HCL237Cp n=1 Tax=Eremothecium sinecaudum TaxID=45286 RepID=A0A0X8HR49_9SACH|nr:HCL237Cp [Eremothecium sinecaudum]AMD19914.1 HCL237Cp [Eremothecium sinecaudum]
MDNYKDNVVLLLLQMLLYRQQELKNKDKALDYEKLLEEPIVDEEVLERFTSHKLVKLYNPYLCTIRLWELKKTVREIFSKGLEDKSIAKLNLVTLANQYYKRRMNELQFKEIPRLKELIASGMAVYEAHVTG